MSETTKRAALSMVIGLGGAVLIGDIKIIVGVFLMLWANNISIKGKE